MEERITEGVNKELLALIFTSPRPFGYRSGLLAYALGRSDIVIRIGKENDEDESDGLWDADISGMDETGLTLTGNSTSHGMGFNVQVTISSDGTIPPELIKITRPAISTSETEEQVKERVSKWKLEEFDYANSERRSLQILQLFL